MAKVVELEDIEIETPICKTTVQEIKGKKLAVVPILRAGLGRRSHARDRRLRSGSS